MILYIFGTCLSKNRLLSPPFTMKYNLVDLFLHIKLLFYGRLFSPKTAVLSLLRVFGSTWYKFSQSIKWWCHYDERIKWQFSVCPLHITNHMTVTKRWLLSLFIVWIYPFIHFNADNWFWAVANFHLVFWKCVHPPFERRKNFNHKRIYILKPMTLI